MFIITQWFSTWLDISLFWIYFNYYGFQMLRKLWLTTVVYLYNIENYQEGGGGEEGCWWGERLMGGKGRMISWKIVGWWDEGGAGWWEWDRKGKVIRGGGWGWWDVGGGDGIGRLEKAMRERERGGDGIK